MDPDPHYAHDLALRSYVEAVARRLGVEPAATWTEYGPPSAAYIALANRAAEYPGRFLMLQWTSDRGWALAVEPEGAERPMELAAWPDTVRPDPGELVADVRRTLTPVPGVSVGLPEGGRPCAR
ncbi:MAG: hypothetical protein GEV28_40255 [Actinophytocola sp.]|uniref:DUF6292 family protein n=1 Tax=Actinophytocola sp. TaxID=1872138 RepID=UPI0013227F7C|nr:DUF6292 family protein [Actinophytocola sp.]MPZ86275.1 hypothetical protein [Actinophytocola sp.]